MPEVAIVGGGLAGMVAALRLLERGCHVTLFEASDRLGGKAGANRHGMDFDEHAYHIFPAWYLNIRKIAGELGIADHFVDCTDIIELRKGDFPGKFHRYHNITSWRSAPHNIFAGFISPIDMCLFFFAVCDLLSQPYSIRSYLDQITVTGFLRSKFYSTKNVELQFEELILKGLSVPSYELSAMTMRQVMSFWVRAPLPLFRILKGNLQEFWIEPLQRRIEGLKCNVRLGYQLEKINIDNGRIGSLSFQVQGQHQTMEHTIDPTIGSVIIAIPAEKIGSLISNACYECAPNLGKLQHLRAAQLAAFNIYFKRRIPYIPKAHVLLADSQFALSFLDVSQFWDGYNNTVLNCMASDFASLSSLTDDAAFDALFQDLRDSIPTISRDDIARSDFQPHKSEPLFMNSVGAWAFRPSESDKPYLRTKTSLKIPNLYLAGDYCRSAIDLVSMEGAVSTGLWAAEAVRKDAKLPDPIEVLEPPMIPWWMWWIIKIPLWPFMTVLGMFKRFFDGVEERNSDQG